MYATLAVIAAFAFVYSLVAPRLERTPVNGAIVFMAFGALTGPLALDWLDVTVSSEALRIVAEWTLALVLFTDSSNANLGTLRRTARVPRRMLLVGLPLTIALGFGVGVLLFPELPLLTVALLATMLAPTDAALGRAVVSNEAVPAPVRESLNVESGLNDGICVPILFTFLALATGSDGSAGKIAASLLAEEIGIGLAVGVGLAVVGRSAIRAAAHRGWVEESWAQLPVVALALASFGLAQTAGGSGFIACFTGGLVFGGLMKSDKEPVLRGAETSGNLLSLLTWVLFGAAVVGNYVGDLDWRVALYAVLSLTVIRMLPVAVSLLGLGLSLPTQAFLGWFGPRGLASVVFAVIVLEKDLVGEDILTVVVVSTVTLSILAHGLTANPLANRFKASR